MLHLRRLLCATALLCLTLPDPARACGGFFCDTGGPGRPPPPAPPVQVSERVVFVHEPGEITAYIQVAWSGDPRSFAWVVPVPRAPEIDTAEAGLFDALDAATAPQFTFLRRHSTETVTDTGESSGACGGGSSGGGEASVATTTEDESETASEVQVLGRTNVGPYETVTLAADDAGALADWLRANGYGMPPNAADILSGYVAKGGVFVGLKLAPGEAGGTLVPLRLRYPGDEPCIPLRITALSTAPTLTVNAMIIGASRWLPATWREAYPDHDRVRPNFGAPTTYATEVDRAVRDAGGRAFVTEYAGPTAALSTEVVDPFAADLLSRGAYITRLFTRVRDIDLRDDPTFYRPETPQRDVGREHTVDLRGDARYARHEVRRITLQTAPALAPLALGFPPLLLRRRRRARG